VRLLPAVLRPRRAPVLGSLTAVLVCAAPLVPAAAVVPPVPVAAASSSPVTAAATDRRAHTVGYDRYSLTVDGRRTFVWSGEFHPFRLPSPSLWVDVLQKMKASGYNAVSVYFDWAYHSAAPGRYDFTGVRDMDAFLDDAARVGIYVIARPGPYINAEVDGGGYPGWLASTPGHARTDDPDYLAASDQWQGAVDAVIARHQLTRGTGSVILYQLENEYANNVSTDTGRDYLAHLSAKARADGITVPLFHNDKGRNGYWTPGSFPGSETNYLYGFDGYPSATGTPPDWGYYGPGGAKGGATASPTTPGFEAEFGGGWFDPWGDATFGGKGYQQERQLTGPGYERRFYLTNVANGIRLQNVYMTYGGTSWGWLPAPVVYTSYDYGAAVDEARQLTDKIPPMKQMGYFLQSVPDIDKTDPAPPAGATDQAVRTYHLANPDTHANFYFVRADAAGDHTFRLPVSTPDGNYTVPQSGTMRLSGPDMRVLTADYALDSQHVVYSTSQLVTHATLDGQDVALLDGPQGTDGETVLRYRTQPTVTPLDGADVASRWDPATGDLRLDYRHDGLARVRISGGGTARPVTLLLADDPTAATFWRQDTTAGPVLLRGPALVRDAAVRGTRIDLTGDTTGAAPLEVWAPHGDTVRWNGRPVPAGRTPSGSLLARTDLPGPPAVRLPALTDWTYHAENPEAAPGFDDSSWTRADHTTSPSVTPVPAGQPVLFADDYGYHYGDVWYRGRWSGTGGADSVTLNYRSGTEGQLQVWLDGQYLGAHRMPTPTAGQATQQTWAASATFPVPPALRGTGDHVLAVLVSPMAHAEDGNSDDAFKTARGLTSVTFGGAAPTVDWRIRGGDALVDPVRGPLNNGGLYGERAGWSLPGYPDAGWSRVSLPDTGTAPGVSWYRTNFALDVPAGTDASLGLTITDPAPEAYRAQIFVNGWNLGLYLGGVGPQHTFALPNGILDPRGRNTVAIAVTRTADAPAGLGRVSLTDLGTAAGGVPLSLVDSPGYVPPTVTPAPIGDRVGPFDGTVATVALPADAAGTQLAATIDWGDGTTSPGTVRGAGAFRTVTGRHTWRNAAHRAPTVVLRDAVGGAVLAGPRPR
jgi:beta-galactosidase GanA